MVVPSSRARVARLLPCPPDSAGSEGLPRASGLASGLALAVRAAGAAEAPALKGPCWLGNRHRGELLRGGRSVGAPRGNPATGGTAPQADGSRGRTNGGPRRHEAGRGRVRRRQRRLHRRQAGGPRCRPRAARPGQGGTVRGTAGARTCCHCCRPAPAACDRVVRAAGPDDVTRLGGARCKGSPCLWRPAAAPP